MKTLIIQIAVKCLQFFNLLFKPLKLKDRVVIISRQADEPTLDIQLLKACLDEIKIENTVLTKTLTKSFRGAVSYGLQMIAQMYHLATSKVVILDGYCILASVLPKKEGQKIVQIWHALGAIKKFGWQSVDNPDGHSNEVAEIMQMHKNYDYVLAPGQVTGAFFAEAFRTQQDRLVCLGLPRIDFLRENNPKTNAEIERDYPVVNMKTNVLYVPTFRKNAALELESLIAGFDFTNLNLIIKKHFLDKGDYTWAEQAGAIVDTKYSSMEWLRRCEKVITDYSAIAFEAAILHRDLYIYQPDASKYAHKVGLNVDLRTEAIGEYVCFTEEELFQKLKQPYDKEKVTAFCQKYIEFDLDECTQNLCAFISRLLAE